VRRNPDRVAGADLPDWTAPGLHVTSSRRDVQSLPERMSMPRRARARLKTHPGRTQQCGIGRLNDRILPHCSGEGRRAHFARRPRSASNDVHDDPLPLWYSQPITFLRIAKLARPARQQKARRRRRASTCAKFFFLNQADCKLPAACLPRSVTISYAVFCLKNKNNKPAPNTE